MNVTEIMTREVVAVSPGDPITTATSLMTERHFEGLPVVDTDGRLIGLISQADLLTKESNIHLPTLLLLLQKFDLYRKDRKFVEKQIKELASLEVRDVMNHKPPTLSAGSTIDDAYRQLGASHSSGPTSVVTQDGKLLGVITEQDIFDRYSIKRVDEPAAKVGNPVRIEKGLSEFLDNLKSNYFFISRWRTKVWVGAYIVIFVAGVIAAAALMLHISVK